MSMPRVIYAVFDRFPAPKGAAVHIGAFSRALGEAFSPVDLVTVADNKTAQIPGVRHCPLPALGTDVISRALFYRRQIAAWWPASGPVEAVHVRSIFEGYPIARSKEHLCRHLVFEVNGLPSIELKYHYPKVAEDLELLAKLRAQEQTCLEAADLILTVSEVTADHLVSRGAARECIRIIPNGVDLTLFPRTPPRPPLPGRELRLLYSGTMASWQGVDRALEALALVRERIPAVLTLAGPVTRTRRETLLALARRLGVAGAVTLLDPVPQEEIARLHAASDIALAPLPANDRNVVQGCCPLKVLEAMASGTPLVASALPVVEALARNGIEALLVRPGSSGALAEAVLRLAADASLAHALSTAARARIEQQFTWEIAGRSLVEAYTTGLGMARSNTRVSATASASG